MVRLILVTATTHVQGTRTPKAMTLAPGQTGHQWGYRDDSPGKRSSRNVVTLQVTVAPRSRQLSHASTALVDLIRRLAGQMRGRKGWWALGMFVQPVGTVAYLLLNRVAFLTRAHAPRFAAIAALAQILRAIRLGVTAGRVGTFGAAVLWLRGTFGPCGRPGLTQDSETGFH